jgi:hypothetical protein
MANKQVVTMLFPRMGRALGFDVVYVVSMRHHWFAFVRLSDSYLTGLIPPFNRIVHYLVVTDSAAYGSLKSIPVDRLRRTYLHLW